MAWCTYARNETLVHQQLYVHQLHHPHPSQRLLKQSSSYVTPDSHVQYTVKPLIKDPPKSGQPLYSGRLTCSRDWFYHRTNTFRTSEKRTPLNSEQTLISRFIPSSSTPVSSTILFRLLQFVYCHFVYSMFLLLFAVVSHTLLKFNVQFNVLWNILTIARIYNFPTQLLSALV